MSYALLATQWASERDKRDRLFCDLADETPTDTPFRLSDCIGKLPCVAHYAAKTQAEILRALACEMGSSRWRGDRIVRVRGGVYRWQIEARETP